MAKVFEVNNLRFRYPKGTFDVVSDWLFETGGIQENEGK